MRRQTVAAIALLLLAGCEASCSTASLSEPAVAAAVDAETQAPIAPATTFPATTGSLYATIRLSSAPADTSVAAHFFYIEGGAQEIASDELVTSGAGYVSFALNPPSMGWPLGRYEVRYLLNGEVAEVLPFAITEAGGEYAAAPAPAAGMPAEEPLPRAQSPTGTGLVADPDAPFAGEEPATPTAGEVMTPPPAADAVDLGRLDAPLTDRGDPGRTWQRLFDADLGFALEVPSDWSYRVLEGGSYIVEGPQGTEAYEVSIIIQIIDRAANPTSSTMAQYQEGLAGAQAISDSEIVEEGLRAIAGQRAPYFLARYTGRDSRGTGMPFGHLHFVLESPRYWYWVSAIAPLDVYRNQQDAIDHAIATFEVGG